MGIEVDRLYTSLGSGRSWGVWGRDPQNEPRQAASCQLPPSIGEDMWTVHHNIKSLT